VDVSVSAIVSVLHGSWSASIVFIVSVSCIVISFRSLIAVFLVLVHAKIFASSSFSSARLA